ncbi:MAG: Ldh family oxidoreductase [Oscillospiraceae bacterium]|nr:Ldh family oxidoreductase [Oscillospiraceae bacterium]
MTPMTYEPLPYRQLSRFCADVFARYGFTPDDSARITEILLCADLYGIESHGVQRLIRYHKEITGGFVNIDANPATVVDTPVSAVIDADRAMGQLISTQAMDVAIGKAKSSGIGMVAVRNSNHFGIAGFYAQMASDADLMGICMTNTEAIGVPTYGKKAMLGTNPIALAFPASPVNFLYDAATTVVPRGKIEVYSKNGQPLPEGWAVDVDGKASADADEILRNIIAKAGGGIAPLGGDTELYGGHKGYGLGIIVDLFCGVFSGGKTSNHQNLMPGSTDITHFFMAVDYGLFGGKEAIRENFSTFLQELRDSPRADGRQRIYTHGEKEQESRAQKLASGIPINAKTREEMHMIAAHQSLSYDDYFK